VKGMDINGYRNDMGCVWEIPGSGRRWNMAFGIFWNRCGTLINSEIAKWRACEWERKRKMME